ncbi:hypothetical protein DJ568_15390 [Mucilaginibacter hurinus]|uniref:Uncharacterized protein n=1 Tax=Mucilaginibacter hurinus TaxID=2201324 RepID=A0A367GMK8_9SPHI|nr:hypothetical protein [Mucilaginibacter hurinus]RCH53921.1 hypothetical protein DJ568_15390 [Mucilaginibacter hurinus]
MSSLKFLPQKVQDELWWLIMSAEYDYERISIADHELDDERLTLWLEDKSDFKNTLDECLVVEIPVKKFAALIKAENLNSYEGVKVHPTKKITYAARIEINEAITWYHHDATLREQRWAREAMLKSILTTLIETGTRDIALTDWGE